jgi:pimeloyl-ACP methyl ester carboxylesterase
MKAMTKAGVATDSTRRTVSIDGCEVAYSETGSGEPVLLIHGNAACLWGDVFPRLGQAHRVIQYDRRSFGRSEHPPLSDQPRHTADAAQLLESLRAKPAIVVGWSAGGLIALELAMNHPELVRGLVLLEPPYLCKTHPTYRMLKGVLSAMLLGSVFRSPRRGAEMFMQWAMMYRSGGTALDDLPAASLEQIWANSAAIVKEVGAGTGEHLSEEQIRAVRCPTHVLAAENSAPSLGLASERLSKLIEGATLHRVRDSGHGIQLDQPDEVIRCVDLVAQSLHG